MKQKLIPIGKLILETLKTYPLLIPGAFISFLGAILFAEVTKSDRPFDEKTYFTILCLVLIRVGVMGLNLKADAKKPKAEDKPDQEIKQ